ncbi:ECF transporter S component [Neglectibacter caecimuris]|uniref:ECF transporter S component n=1 Tax=Neglectibacter caecimuris TaxID=3093658 RepID=UPI002AC9D6C8|nr:ECF transporter S component [Neglectibacter sp. M00184]
MEKGQKEMQSAFKIILKIVLTALFAALTFIGSMIYIPIPAVVGNVSRIHLGNIFCLLSGLILGPIGGGLAAGTGSALFDVMNPKYIASAPFTFVFKFALAAVCGVISAWAEKRGKSVHAWNVVASIAGSVLYMVCYLSKAFVESTLLGNELQVTMLALGTKAVTSGINAVIAVVVSVPLYTAIRAALKRSGMAGKLAW